jgi:hypothetical protein
MILDRPDIKAIWANCRDSLFHAARHFGELECTRKNTREPWHLQDTRHHCKWATFSVAHAADCFLKIVVRELDPDSDLFRHEKRLFYNPSVIETIDYLKRHHATDLTNSWGTLFGALTYVHEQRNWIVHHMIPEELDTSACVAAWALLGLSRSISDRYGISAETWSDCDRIEETLFNLIRLPRLAPYLRYVENVMAEESPDSMILQCPLCGTSAVRGGRCEACFANLTLESCSTCGEEVIVPDDSQLAEHLGLNVCPSCGAEL